MGVMISPKARWWLSFLPALTACTSVGLISSGDSVLPGDGRVQDGDPRAGSGDAENGDPGRGDPRSPSDTVVGSDPPGDSLAAADPAGGDLDPLPVLPLGVEWSQ